MAIPTHTATWLSGYIPDLPTPFDAKGEIDLNAFRVLCERQIEAGVPALVVCEAAGETSTLSPAEQESVTRTAVEGTASTMVAIATPSDPLELNQQKEWCVPRRACLGSAARLDKYSRRSHKIACYTLLGAVKAREASQSDSLTCSLSFNHRAMNRFARDRHRWQATISGGQ